MIYFNKIFKLPGPKDLGMSNSNHAMPSELFRNNKTEYTWEQYYARLQQEYPVKFFLASTLPTFFRHLWLDLSRPFKDFYYWLVSHTLRRYHMLDLRQPKDSADTYTYRYGWCDTDHRMVFALFNLLKEFVESEAPYGYYVPSEEDVAKDDGLKRQLDNHKEYMAIYNWWIKERHIELAEEDTKLREWSDARKAWADNERELWKELQAIKKRNENKLEEMLHRLITVRRCLWT